MYIKFYLYMCSAVLGKPYQSTVICNNNNNNNNIYLPGFVCIYVYKCSILYLRRRLYYREGVRKNAVVYPVRSVISPSKDV